MNPQAFGTSVLQLIDAATFPGSALDTLIAFREQARALAEGRSTIIAIPTTPPTADEVA